MPVLSSQHAGHREDLVTVFRLIQNPFKFGEAGARLFVIRAYAFIVSARLQYC